LNITFIVKEFPKISETFITGQVDRLLDLGHDVRVISLKRPKNTAGTPDYGNRVLYLGYKDKILHKFASVACRTFSGGFSPDFLRHMRKCPDALSALMYQPLREGILDDADIVLFHFGDLAHKFVFLKNRLGIHKPYLIVFHGVDIARCLPDLPMEERQQLWDFMTHGLPVSEFWKQRLISLGCPGEKLTVHHMGVCVERFVFRERRPSTGTVRLLSVCRLVEKKGIDCAIHGVAALMKLWPERNVLYNIIGDGPERDSLKTLVRELGIERQIFFHGSMPSEQTVHFFDEAKVYLLPSRTASNGDMEGIPVSLMEAMACGLPVVSTYHSGIPELVRDGESGLLVEENDTEGITVALGRLVSEPELGPMLGQEARNVVERKFRHDTLMRDLETLFESLGGSPS